LNHAYISDAASAIAPRYDERGYLVYHGLEDEIIPEDVTRVRIHSSVGAILRDAFSKRITDDAYNMGSRLTTVTLGEGLEEIGKRAFKRCKSLKSIMIPRTVKKLIKRHSQIKRVWISATKLKRLCPVRRCSINGITEFIEADP
jgi:hypothetical protein